MTAACPSTPQRAGTTGIDPFTNKPVNTAKNLLDWKLQRALMQFFKPRTRPNH